MGQRGSLGSAVTGVIDLGDSPYSIVGDGVADDSAALQSAIDYLAGLERPGGEVRIPAGATLGIGTKITMSNDIRLTGGNRNTSKLKKLDDIILVDLSGTDSFLNDGGSANHIHRCVLQDLSLDGGSDAMWTEPLVRSYYGDTHFFERVDFRFNYGEAVRMVETWDSSFHSCRFDQCGGAAGSGKPAVNILGRDGASGFGSTTDNNNVINFYDCWWEAFRVGALWIRHNGNTTTNNHNIRVTDCKIENVELLGEPIWVESGTSVHFKDLYAYAGGFAPGYSTATDFFTLSSFQDSSINGLFLGASDTASLVRAGVSLRGGNRRTTVTRVVGNFAAAPTVALVEFRDGNNTDMEVGQVIYRSNPGSGAVFSGVPDSPWKRRGTGSPEGVIYGQIGSEWIRTDGGASTTYYVKESGAGTNTGWVAK